MKSGDEGSARFAAEDGPKWSQPSEVYVYRAHEMSSRIMSFTREIVFSVPMAPSWRGFNHKYVNETRNELKLITVAERRNGSQI
jgi:hypothetical protein